ncbi:hypothetical protein K437DRAFT_181480 [Tilletiaria anomala UBC 951]|uniref:Uncharacterized protein n=1 Tax=Tilletiaria anomala (strain ATCC 24038 / CBS 436.72 / UBC 951) TaxID=1037660 RepID=A0A066VHK8_TILAU|nr:uncharacterized protein K437DRAFT_181480 [Tilletiaria anomala UBC 951]KDN40966.1 hypothetical protein K437DRAFT_181480 [Tilletiaria anomala UBC 951]
MSAAVANRPYIYVHCGHADLDSASHVSRFPPAGTKSALSSVNMSEGIAIQHPLGSPPHTEESSPTVQASYSASDSYTGLRDDLETEAVDLGLKPSLSTNTSGFYASNATVDRDLGLLHSPGVNSDINFSDIQSPLDALAGQGFGRRAGMYSAVSDCSEGTYGGDANQGPAASTDHLTPAASIHGGGKPDVKAEGSGTALYAAEEGSARRFSSFRKKLNLPRESYNAEEEDTQNIQLVSRSYVL